MTQIYVHLKALLMVLLSHSQNEKNITQRLVKSSPGDAKKCYDVGDCMYRYKPISRLVDISRLLRRKENPNGKNNVRLQIPNHSKQNTLKRFVKASPDHRCGRYKLISGASS